MSFQHAERALKLCGKPSNTRIRSGGRSRRLRGWVAAWGPSRPRQLPTQNHSRTTSVTTEMAGNWPETAPTLTIHPPQTTSKPWDQWHGLRATCDAEQLEYIRFGVRVVLLNDCVVVENTPLNTPSVNLTSHSHPTLPPRGGDALWASGSSI